jgi:RNA polymerase sigma-70 factor (ECF subfamily)
MAASDDLSTLLSRVALHDRAAFKRVYELTSAHLFGVALRILNRREAAEDTLQEAYVNVWNAAGSYSAAVAQPMTWLISIVRNKALDRLRGQQRRAEESLSANDDEGEERDIVDERPDPLGLLTQAADALRIRDCMGTLDATHRQCLALAYYHGMSHSEVAEHIGSPLGSVKAWVRRGLERLKKCLGD